MTEWESILFTECSGQRRYKFSASECAFWTIYFALRSPSGVIVLASLRYYYNRFRRLFPKTRSNWGDATMKERKKRSDVCFDPVRKVWRWMDECDKIYTLNIWSVLVSAVGEFGDGTHWTLNGIAFILLFLKPPNMMLYALSIHISSNRLSEWKNDQIKWIETGEQYFVH